MRGRASSADNDAHEWLGTAEDRSRSDCVRSARTKKDIEAVR